MVDILVRNGLEEEVIEDWKVSSAQKKVWNIELLLARELLRICKLNDIQCIAGFGTLLGAIRHNGFIPWDDDMDFLLLREDYEKLCSIANQFSEPFFFQTTKSENGKWFRGYARLRYSHSTCINPLDDDNFNCNNGVFIDIFPLDKVPLDKYELDQFRNKVISLKSLILHKVYCKHYTRERNIKQYIYAIYSTIFSLGKSNIDLSNKYDKLCSKYNSNEKLDIYRMLAFSFVKGSRVDFNFKYSDIFPTIVHKFENIEIPIPKNWDNNLRIAYGNSYMEYPPLSARNAQDKNTIEPDIPYNLFMLKRKNKNDNQS